MKWIFFSVFAIFFSLVPVHGELRLPAVISDHAMFQADKPIAIWGWAEPGAQIKVAFSGSSPGSFEEFAATADATGKWSGQLAALKSGTAGHLKVTTDKGGEKTVNDILVGEVWLGGGQSNMAYDIAGKYFGGPANPEEAAEDAQNLINAQKEADAAQPPIRYFGVNIEGESQPADDVKGSWMLTNGKNVDHLSAVAWNFGIALQNKLHVPIGLMVSCVGGTPVEAWMSKETLMGTGVGPGVLDRHNQALAAATPEVVAKYNTDLQAWNAANPTKELQQQNAKTKPKAPYSETSMLAPIRYYNGMIRGLEPYTVRGVIWFQADGNMGHPLEYGEMFRALIKEWRTEWNDPKLPFYFVEMNNMREVQQTKPVQPNALSIIREQQHAGLLEPGVDMVCAIDVGTVNPHFPNKKPVGERLAGLALRDCYGQSGKVESPIYKSFAVEGNKIRLTFTNADGLRVRGGGEIEGFAVRGSTGDWVWATGKIDGQDIVVWNDQVSSPAAVRYAWAMNPIISIENDAGLPLYPFRTDTESEK